MTYEICINFHFKLELIEYDPIMTLDLSSKNYLNRIFPDEQIWQMDRNKFQIFRIITI